MLPVHSHNPKVTNNIVPEKATKPCIHIRNDEIDTHDCSLLNSNKLKIIGWVVCSDAVVESCDAVLIFVVTASRYICDAVSSHCREILDQCWCSSQPKVLDEQEDKTIGTNEGTGTKPGVPNVPSYLFKSENEFWGDSGDDNGNDDDSDEVTKDNNLCL
ncbi:hypothetical protein Tco_0086630 [Tanacetum coccineum]